MRTGTFRGGLVAGIALTALAAAAIATFASLGFATPVSTAAQLQYAPVNTVAPTITGTAAVGQTLTANEGTWTGDQPIVFTYQWHRCNAAGAACVAIPGATAKTYTVQANDQGTTLRAQVTATNTQGSGTATSAQTGVVGAGSPHPPGATTLPNGQISIPVTSVNPPERLVIEHVQFNPNPVRSRFAAFQVRTRVIDTRGYVVRGAHVFVRSTPLVTNTPPEGTTGDDGWVTYTVTPNREFRVRTGYNVQFFVRARKAGDDVLAGVSTRRLVQVATRS